MEYSIQFSQSLSRVRLFATPWIAARQASLSITNSRSPLKLMSIESVMPSSHLILCRCRPPWILLSHKTECIWVSSNEVDETRAYYTEWSKSEREKNIYQSIHMESRGWYWPTYLQGSSGDTDIENRLTDSGRGEEESETEGETSMEAYTLPYVK